MEKYLKTGVLILCMLIVSMPLISANTMIMSSATMGPSQNFSLNVKINNSNPFVAFQFDLALPPGFSFVENSAVLNPARSSGHTMSAQLIPGNKLRVVGYSNANIPFLGDTGTVVHFQLRSGKVPGTFPLNLLTPIIGDSNQVNILTGSTNGAATLLAPDINIALTTISFDRTPLGSHTTRTLNILNTGNQPLNITSITFNSPYFAVVGSTSFTIPAYQNSIVTIKFNSVVKGSYDKTMTVTSNDPEQASINISLHAIAFAVNELHTGNLSVYSGKQGALIFSINNMEPFTGFQFDLLLPSQMTYINGSAVLSGRKTNHIISASTIPGNKLRIVAYSPDKQILSGNSGAVVSLTFLVVGTGGGYPLTISNVVIGDTLSANCLSDSFNGTLQIAAPDIHCATSIAMGDVSVLEIGHKTLQIYNYGSDTLKIHQVTLSNSSYSLITVLPQNILPGQIKTFQVDFHQTIKGQSNGIMKIYSNDPEAFENPMVVHLSAFSYTPNYMIVPDCLANNVATINIPVKVNNIEPFVGFQFDFTYPAFLTYIPNSALLGSRASTFMIFADTVNATKVRVIGYSLNQYPVQGDTGTLVTLGFEIHAGPGTPGFSNLNLSDVVLGNADQQNILYAIDNGLLTIQNSIFSQLSLTNQSFAAGVTNCFNALQTITVAGNGTTFIIQNEAYITLIAGQNVRLLPGTTVQSGGHLWAYITTNGTYCIRQSYDIPAIESTFFRIYPNPTHDKFTLEINAKDESIKSIIRIYSMLGKLIFKAEVTGNSNLDVSLYEIPAGIYIVNITQGNNIRTAKIIKR